MRYANLPLLQVCLVLLLGIWTGFLDFDLNFSTYVSISLSLFVVFLAFFLAAKLNSSFKLIFTFIALLFVFSLGVINTKTHLPEHQNTHFTNSLSTNSKQNKYISFEGVVAKSLKSSAYKDKFELNLKCINGEKTKGKVLFQIPVSQDPKINSNSIISGYGRIKSFQEPLNPQQFNYKDYMATQQMSHVLDSNNSEIKITQPSDFSFISFGENARQKIQKSLQNYSFSKSQMDLMQALLLGQKQDIDPETYDRFSKAGVVHILAVSGLHVGIILLILQFITKGLLRIKYGRFIRAIVVFLGIWGFATLAGFSPSVLRAAVMFSLLSIALNYKRKTSAINTLAISAILLLMYNPFYIYQVGFQLSYLAVISIVILQPRLSRLYKPKYVLDKKIWDIITVTLTAQIGVLPLSLYYFHQFPGLFLISNLVILPVLGILLGGGILVIILSLVGLLPEFFSSGYGLLLDLLLDFVNWVASKENLVFADIYFTKSMLITSLILLFSVILWNSKNKFWSYSLLNLSLLALLICTHIEKRNQLQQEESIIFQTYRNSQLGLVKGAILNLYSDNIEDKDSIKNSYHIKNYIALKGIDTIQIKPFRSLYDLGSKKLLVIDSASVYPKLNFQPDVVLLKNSPNVNLDRVLLNLKPKQIIADGSNFKTDIERWQTSARKFDIEFHSTWENGAFILPKD